MIKNKNVGTTLEDFLKKEGRLEEARAVAIKRVVAWELLDAMKRQKITKVELARRLKTSRTQVERILDPANDKVTLLSIAKAASALDKKLILKVG